jgi:isopenicillin N synthase-like dioxygenase
MSLSIPVIDISPLREGKTTERAKVAAQISVACADSGFFTVVGHGVETKLLDSTRRAAAKFFDADDHIKNAVLRPPEKISRGWNPPADRSLANTLGEETPPDLQEAWAMGSPNVSQDAYFTKGVGAKIFAENRWPEIDGFRAILEQYYRAMTELSDIMLCGFALSLGLDENFFTTQTDKPGSIVRLVRYPAQHNAPLPGQLRAGAHSDYGSFTFVRGDNVSGGLQVSDGAGGWRDVEAPETGFVCNIGDTMQLWTGGRFRSTLHRVVNPSTNALPEDRISLVYFHLPNHDAVLGGIGKEDRKAPNFAEHYFGKMVRAAKSVGGGSTTTAAELMAGDN